MSKEFLRQLSLFAGLPEEDLDRLYEMAETVSIAAGQTLVAEGEPGDAMYIALEGRFEVSKRAGERDMVLAESGPGDVIGEISLLEGCARTATVRAVEDGRLLKISQDSFQQLLQRSPSAALGVVRTMTQRLRNTEAMLRQSEKMAALGTLSAGLAHELNNPAAAVRRSAGRLRETLAELQRLAAELGSLGLSAQGMERMNALRRELPQRAADPVRLDPLERSDLEGDVGAWMEQQGVEEPWELAPSIVALGWNIADLEEMTIAFTEVQRPGFLSWLATGCSAYALLDEVGQGAERISEIVKAVKSYSRLDQAPVQLVDVHEGLDNTLVILRHKLKEGVTVIKEYATGLPRIEAYASELNQVWTNLIDNAVDAMGGKGELHIHTSGDDGQVVVEITDNGPGILPENQARVFDAFYTTKPVGSGTGLGLHITYNIVVQHHHGEIQVESQPGRTTFRVTLPVQLGSGAGPAISVTEVALPGEDHGQVQPVGGGDGLSVAH
jgi:signal transduction histidine kinase